MLCLWRSLQIRTYQAIEKGRRDCSSTGETEVEDKDLVAAGAGVEDRVNAVEFVPGQLHCGHAAPSCTEAPLQGMVIEKYEKQQANLEMKK
ncbi:UNVERIFIED_CONTAM: E3 ubiquitin-protein ligase makorin-1 [Gekko kuhli]